MKTTGLAWISLGALAAALSLVGCGDGTGGAGETVRFSGIAWAFNLPGTPYGKIEGATVWILEMPELSTTTNADGEFTIEGLPVGSQATPVLEHPNHPLTYTKTHLVPDSDLDDLTFQIPTNVLFGLIESGLVDADIIEEVDPNKCQIVSTFTRYGKTIGDSGPHGEPGAVLSIAPANDAEAGPIYFGDDVLPDPTRSYSSLDGGVLLLNVEPGDYTLTASCVEDPDDVAAFLAEYPPEEYPDESLRCQTEDVQFESILVKCRPGVFLNASPSYGLQALE
jgi:hypothetical protein